jgi:pimeloyl-ACP methyl ester carboxylesterase
VPRPQRCRVRGLDYRVTRWDGDSAEPVVLLHGWMDTGTTFQFLVDEMPDTWSFAAPDWRGFGDTAWAPGGYWFPDYYADLDVLLDQLCPGEAATLIGHSMGGNIVLSYAGLRPERVRRVVCIEGFGLARTQPGDAPARQRRWLEQLREEPDFAVHPTIEALVADLRRRNPRLDAAQADFVARCWARQHDDGTWRIRSDPAHKRINPVLYRREEAEACWRRIEAPLLYVIATESTHMASLGVDATVERMSTLIRRLEPTEIAGAGHMIHHEQPRALAAAIVDFFGRS